MCAQSFYIFIVEITLSLTGNNLSNIPKDSELYKAKRSEALRKYEM